jgi:glycosyltransferase involved in cell wall biosynthesis
VPPETPAASDGRLPVSIVIDNYNYGRFLRDAVESALGQHYPEVEVVVVDDGSTDGSREIIAGYGGRLVAVLKENGGQASAFNEGFAASRGEVVIFLDADDALAPTAAAEAVRVFEKARPVKVHWPLRVMDEQGRTTGRLWPPGRLPDGDFRELTLRLGPSSSYSPPTSGNAWARGFLASVLPVPEDYRICADDYLYALAPAFGPIRRVDAAQGFYRLHGRNNYLTKTFEERLALGSRMQDQQCAALGRHYEEENVHADVGAWKRHLWFHRLRRAVETITARVPLGSSLVLIDEDQWAAGRAVAGRPRRHLVERNGQYWGPPASEGAAIDEVERLRRQGAQFVAVAWPAFWWLQHYREWDAYLRSKSPRIAHDGNVALFDMREGPRAEKARS